MSDRITVADLEAVCRRIQVATTGTSAIPLWAPYKAKDGTHVNYQSPGIYHLSGAYGGYALHRSSDLDANGESHGVSDVFGCGHMSKRELYDRMQAFLRGIEATGV